MLLYRGKGDCDEHDRSGVLQQYRQHEGPRGGLQERGRGEGRFAAFAAADVWAFGSPASGTEEINDTEVLPLIEALKDHLKGKKVFLFGSYGWGGGAFMDAWKQDMEGRGAVIAAEPVTCLEAPDGAAESAMRQAAEALLG